MARSERPLAGQPWLRAPASRRVLRALEAGGREARFVGGCVRDGLLGRPPAAPDLDLATPEVPTRVMALLADAGIRTIPTGLDHGTVTAVIDEARFEITTLRQDVATDGRHAEVAFTDDFALDAARRDFTINAMSCDRDGRLFDDHGGRDDLAAGRVRFVGEAARRIAEDYLRILRFFRFFAHYGSPPADPEALRAVADAALEIARLSGERIQREMLRLLEADDPVPALGLMIETGVADQVFATALALERLRRLLDLASDGPPRGQASPADPLLRLAALLRTPAPAQSAVDRLAERWRLSNPDRDRLHVLTATPLPALRATPAERHAALYRRGAGTYTDLARLAAADERGDARGTLEGALAAAARWQRPSFPVGGDDVLALGVAPGPRVGSLLSMLEDWWIDHDFQPDRTACLAELRRLEARPDDGPAAPT